VAIRVLQAETVPHDEICRFGPFGGTTHWRGEWVVPLVRGPEFLIPGRSHQSPQ
jgi:hypothetical protein